ncbi:MAG: hypothetical protein HY270_06785 [Deltaproteobacteria bacterium]|nr:hypothetical protein [Deltaproteobacteria bacterium]
MPSFRQRLSPARQRVYDRSNATTSIPLKASPELRIAVGKLPEALATADPHRVQDASQYIADEICRLLRVPRVGIQVQGTRPSNARGELHGLYTPLNNGSATIKVWMITAKLGKVVAFKTYLRTLLHEICHHLDYALLRLSDSLHTDGFYKRENSLFYQIGGATVGSKATAKPSDAEASWSSGIVRS